MKKFDITINNNQYSNLTLIKVLEIVQYYLAKDEISNIPYITNHDSGEIINFCEFKFANDTRSYNLEDLLEMLPYLKTMKTIHMENELLFMC